MNFLDTFDIASPATPVQATNSTQGSTQSLNDEVNEVVGQLSRFWGGFRKQSQSVFETAKKDLEEAYTQAQKEISKLTAEPEASTSSRAAGDTTPDDAADSLTKPPSKDSDGDEDNSDQSRIAETAQATPGTSSGHARTASQNFFHRLQSSLPPTLVASVQNVQNQLPDSLKQGDFTQIRTSLATEFQRVQGITRAQAEEYVHKSEGLLREAQEFLKDAVKVVPPDQAGAGGGGSVASAGMLWDGSDLWMLPDVGGSSTKGKDKEVDNPVKSGAEGLRAVATRAESLLKQLRHDPEIIKVDPMADERAKALYEQWIREKVTPEEGGIGGKHWSEATQEALSDQVDGSALNGTHDALVPEHITTETFWTRYFFRVHQVQQDEQRRKALVQGMADDEDFSWEDDDEEATSPTEGKPAPSEDGGVPHSLRASIDTLQAPRAGGRLSSEQSSPRTSDADLSRRQSSEGSYDVVSSQVSASGEFPAFSEEKKHDREDDEEDSDWE